MKKANQLRLALGGYSLSVLSEDFWGFGYHHYLYAGLSTDNT